MADEQMRRESDTGSATIVRGVPQWQAISLVVTLILQGISGVWWAATLTAEMKGLSKEVQSLQSFVATNAANRYTTADAVRDQTRIAADQAQILQRVEQQDLRMRDIERQLWRSGMKPPQ